MKAKHFSLFVLALLAALCGCSQPIVNLTPPSATQNDSGIYTLSMNARLPTTDYVTGSMRAFIEIEGKEHEMKRAPYGDLIYTYEFAMAPTHNQAKYYFTLKYDTEDKSGIVRAATTTSQLYTMSVLNHYVLALVATRGSVGSVISVVGNGFSRLDRVVIGGLEAPTTYSSANAITFAVPPLPANHDYMVELNSAGGNVFPIGPFRVDPSVLTVTPASLDLASGDSVQLIVNMGRKAPEGGVPVDARTDVPASIVMPVITIPGGSPTVSAKITAGQPGKGTLHLSAQGFDEVLVPVNVVPAPDKPAAAPAPAPVAPQPAAAVKMGS